MAQRDPRKWDPRFMAMARVVRDWSSDPRKRVGAVVVSPDGRRFSAGYNGPPRDFSFPAEMIVAKETKNRYALHAEANAIAQAGTDVTGWTMYVTEAPCLRCALDVHRAGISRVVVDGPLNPDSSWHDDQVEAQSFLEMMGVDQAYLEAPCA